MSKNKRKQIVGVYCIRRDDKFYVGQSIDILGRFTQHKNSLRSGRHHSQKLQKAYNKYGIDYFSFEIIEECLESDLAEKEQYWCDTLDAASSGYNIAKFVVAPMKGRRCSEETRKNMSNAQFKRFELNPMAPLSEERRKKMSEAALKRIEENPALREELSLIGSRLAANNIGRKHSGQALKNMTECKKHLPLPSEETKMKISEAIMGEKNPFYGKNHSEETKAMLSSLASERTGEKNSFYGKNHSKETKALISSLASERTGDKNSFYGKKHSEESLKKMSLAKKNKGISSGKKCNISIARLIRADYANGISRSELCKKYNISKTQISQIVTNKSWKEEWFTLEREDLNV